MADAVVSDPHDVETPAVVRALNLLPDDDRELLRLVAWEQLGRDEIAIALGCSRATVRVRLHRARNRLKAAMAGVEEPDRSAERRLGAVSNPVPAILFQEHS